MDHVTGPAVSRGNPDRRSTHFLPTGGIKSGMGLDGADAPGTRVWDTCVRVARGREREGRPL